MKILIYFIFAVFIFYKGAISFAVMDEGVSEDDVIRTVIEERIEAKQDYQNYKIQKESQERAPIQIKVPMVYKEQDLLYTKSRNDMLIGIGLILAAVILTAYVHQLTKKEQRE